MVEAISEIEGWFIPLISFGSTIMAGGGVVMWIKKVVNSGMVSKDELDANNDKLKADWQKYTDDKIAQHKEQTTKDDAADKKWLNTLQDKVEANGKNIYKIAGKVGIDL